MPDDHLLIIALLLAGLTAAISTGPETRHDLSQVMQNLPIAVSQAASIESPPPTTLDETSWNFR